jgi:hypothetical protein
MEAIMRYGFHELFLNYLCLTVQIRYTVLYVLDADKVSHNLHDDVVLSHLPHCQIKGRFHS